MTTRTELFAVSIIGPDDLVAAASYADAVKIAHAFNSWWVGRLDKLRDLDPHLWAVPITWPWSAPDHAANLAKAATTGEYAGFVSAALAAGRDEPAVKALVWYVPEWLSSTWFAHSVLGQYSAWDGYWRHPGADGGAHVEGGLDGAKVAAQADYEQRILSALEPARPALVAEPAPVALRDVLRAGFVENHAEEYEWRGDGGDYTPTGDEVAMLVDFGHSLLSELPTAALAHIAPPAGPEHVSALRQALEAQEQADRLQAHYDALCAADDGGDTSKIDDLAYSAMAQKRKAKELRRAALAQSAAPVAPEGE